MLIWNRWGFLVPLICFACLLLAEFLSEAATGDDNYYQKHGWPMSVAFTTSALILMFLSTKIRSSETRVLLDPETGQEFLVGERSSFFFLPMNYWPAVLIVLAVVSLWRI